MTTGGEPGGSARGKIGSGYEFKHFGMRNPFIHDRRSVPIGLAHSQFELLLAPEELPNTQSQCTPTDTFLETDTIASLIHNPIETYN